MKKLVIIIVSFILITGCSDEFLNTENKNNLDSSSFMKTEDDLKLAVNAAYTPLSHHGMFGLMYYMIFNSLDPYIWLEGQSSYDIMNFNPSTGDILNNFKELYVGLFRTSDILDKMQPLKDKMNPADYVKYEAQLKAIRGMCYFYLVTLYDTPIYYDETSVPVDPLKAYSNGTREQFWTKLEEDLTFAAATLPEIWPADETGRITKGAANAQLGKALLYKHYHYYLRFGKENTPEAAANLIKSRDAFKAVMTSSKYNLTLPAVKDKQNYQAALLSNFSFINIPVGTTTYKAENNSESVWEIQYNDNPGTNVYLPGYLMGGNMLCQYFSTHASSYKNMIIDPALWNEFETVTSHPAGYTKDPRAYATCYVDGDFMDWRSDSPYNKAFSGNIDAKAGLFTNIYQGFTVSKALGMKKYFYPTYTTGSAPAAAPVNFRVIRYADVLLMYAEACFQSNTEMNSGLLALNEVRARVDMPAVSELSPATIVHERNVELATEGHRYNDIIRWSYDTRFGINFNTLFNSKFDIKKHLYFPIPQYEIDANKGALKQNSGW